MNKEVDELREEAGQLNSRLSQFDELAAKDFATKVHQPLPISSNTVTGRPCRRGGQHKQQAAPAVSAAVRVYPVA